jgi:Cu/Ag efflux pump CusA
MLQPLAIAVIGGLTISLVLSLIITPTVHYHLSHGTGRQSKDELAAMQSVT